MSLLSSDQYLSLRGMRQGRVEGKDGILGNWKAADLSPEFSTVGHAHVGKTIPLHMVKELRLLTRRQHHSIDKHIRRFRRAGK